MVDSSESNGRPRARGWRSDGQPDEVADAIAEAHAAGMAPSRVQRQLKAGKLDGLERVVDLSDSTFFPVLAEGQHQARDGAQQQQESAWPA